MKVEELMIGDWVKISHLNKIGKVYRIDRANGKGNGFAAVIDGDYYEGNLEPIPLTTEILEKNGFEKTWQDNFVYDNEDIGLIITFHPKETNYTNGIYDYIDIEKGCVTITEMPIEFVHQLQHALRLCGIEKEIEL